MATTVKDARRCDMFAIAPEQIAVVEDLRGRCSPPTEAAIISMAESLMEHGQQQPCVARKVGEKLQLVSGFTRVAPARLIRTGFYDSTGAHVCDPDFQVRVVLKNVNDEGSFIANIVENRERNATSPMDDAHNQDKLRDRYAKSDADIARLYRYDGSTVARLKRLLSLPAKVQEQVHLGMMPVQAALDLQELPPAKQEKAIAEATKPNGRVSGAKVREQVRDHHLSDHDEAPPFSDSTPDDAIAEPARAVKKPRTVKEIREFFEQAMEEEGVTDEVKTACKVAIGFINGQRTSASLSRALGFTK